MSDVTIDVKEVRLSIGKIKPGMVTARDVLGPSGIVLIAKDTIIQESSYLKMLDNNIKEAFIKQASISQSQRAISTEDFDAMPLSDTISVSKQAEFKVFLANYNEKLKITKNKIQSISKGDKINLDELYAISSASMEKIKCKSDILSYIGFMKSHDEYTFSHSNNVALLCNLFSYWLGLSDRETLFLTTAGLLHDVGKMNIPGAILNKRTPLTSQELEIIKTHAIQGYKILQTQDIPNEIKLAALLHHERIDGTGYPMGKKGDEISKFAKIIAICDVYEAMTAKRPYRNSISPFDVIKHFEVSSFSELDTEFLLLFIKNIAYTYYGRWIKLSDGRRGEIVFIHPQELSRPMVKVDGEIIDLRDNLALKVEEVL